MPEVFFADEQADEEVPGGRLCDLARFVLSSEQIPDRAEVSLLAVDPGTMADLNMRYREREEPTDVLAFPIDGTDDGGYGDGDGVADEPPLLLGDIVVCPSVARHNARQHAGSYGDELELLVVHGILHLLGYDHGRDTDAEQMEALERDLLSGFRRVVTEP